MTLTNQDAVNLMTRIFDIRKKIKDTEAERSVERNLKRMLSVFEDAGYKMHDPLHEDYNETRVDCEAKIAGDSADNLKITEVIKPIIYLTENGQNFILQKGIVIAEQPR